MDGYYEKKRQQGETMGGYCGVAMAIFAIVIVVLALASAIPK